MSIYLSTKYSILFISLLGLGCRTANGSLCVLDIWKDTPVEKPSPHQRWYRGCQRTGPGGRPPYEFKCAISQRPDGSLQRNTEAITCDPKNPPECRMGSPRMFRTNCPNTLNVPNCPTDYGYSCMFRNCTRFN